ncbi:hypothetical protein H6P81_010610 [Aristolochia fimbriata]|uniref:Uncharacterized protein n=1 Tax=Aristolochia fimbriata TaxID=158543 RepID=A0AAV7EP89_ARIFI|nr:hypothetical protein H6P81_010610 [Aristolochia fimbriata]
MTVCSSCLDDRVMTVCSSCLDDRVFFLSCPDSLEKEDEAAGPEAFVLQSASCLVNRPPLPRIFEDGVVERALYTPDTTLDTSIPFLFEWTTLFLGRCSCTLHNAGVFYAWSTKTNTLVTCQGELSITLMDIDRIFGLPISGQFYDEISPMRRLEPTVSATAGSDGEEEDYDSDRSHPRKRRSKGKKPVSASPANKKRAPLITLKDASGSASRKKKARVEVQPTSLPSPLTFIPPISEVEPQPSCPPLELDPPNTVHIPSSPEAPKAEAPQEEASLLASTVPIGSCTIEGTEVVGDLVEIPPSSTQLEFLQEVAPPAIQEEATTEEEAPAPVFQEAEATPSIEEVVEVEAPTVQEEAILVLEVQEEASIVQEEAPTSVVEAPAIEEVIEIVQEEVPTAVAEVAEVFLAVEEVAEVVLAVEEVADVVPAVEEVPIVHDTTTSLTLLTLRVSTSLATPSQQLLSHVEGVMLQVYTQKLQALKDIESLAGEKASRTSRDWAESDAREALDVLSSKLENAEITLDEAAEDLSEAKADEEDARERLELAREQLQSAETKVVYLTTQVEQIRESVRDLKKAVVGAEQKVAEVIARPTLRAAEKATLLSLRADFVELQ